MDDWDLLEQFRLAASDHAFGELVRRHAGFVLATCRRRLRDPHLSEDAAQAVFLILARKPPVRSAANASLAGWLYKTAAYACSNAMQSRRSRQMHEQRAAAEAATLSEPPKLPSDAEILLDQALAMLSAKERDAVLLRYYEDRSVQQVGVMLGISQNSATKRISRAIDRLREFLSSKGLLVTSPALLDLVIQTMRGSPVTGEFLAQTISIGTGELAAPVVVQQLAQGVNSMIRIAQVKLVAAVVIGVITAGGGIIAVNQLMAGDPKPTASATTQPAAKPAAVKPFKADTPKQLLKEFAAAVRKGDASQLPAMATGDTDEERELMKAAADYVEATGHFTAAVRDKFGAEAERELQSLLELTPIGRFCLFIETSVDTAPEQIDGNVAMIQPPDVHDLTFWLVNVDGQWKLSTQRMTETWTPENWRERLDLMKMAAQGLGHFTQAIAAGKYTSFAEIKRDIAPILRQNR